MTNEITSKPRKPCKGRGKHLLGLGLIGVAIAGTITLIGCSRHRSPEKKARWVTKIISSELDLNDSQEKKLSNLKDAFLKAHQRNRSERDTMSQKIEALILSEKVEEAQVRKLMDERRKRMDSEIPQVFPKLKEFHASLTPEQKKKAVETFREFRKRMHH